MDIDPVLLAAADVVVATALAAGAVLAGRRNRWVGALLAATAAAWLVAGLWEVALFWHRALLFHTVLAYPGIRPPTRTAGGVLGSAYVVCVLFPAVLLDDRATVACGVALVSAAEWNDRFAPGRSRRQRRTGLVAGACYGGVMAVTGLVGGDRTADMRLVVYEAVVVVTVVVVVTGLRPPSVHEVAGLVVELGEAPADALRDAIARAVRDPDVRIGYWEDGAGRYVDTDDAPVDAAPDDGRWTAVRVDHDDAPFAVVLLDPALAQDPEVIAAVRSAARVVAVNARRSSDVEARVRDLEQSRRRLVEAADDERAVLEGELRSGVLSDIADLASCVRRLDEVLASPHLTKAATHLEHTVTDLADVAAGLGPRDLGEGLGPALRRLAAESPLPVRVVGEPGPLRPAVELTVWYLCSEAMANAAKHASARGVEIELSRGDLGLRVAVCDDGAGGAHVRASGGLAGMRDRVMSYGGRLEVTSGSSGTALVAELPLDDQC